MGSKSLVRLEGYDDFLRDLKARIQSAQFRAALAVNRELVLLYWQIGRDILERQAQQVLKDPYTIEELEAELGKVGSG